MAERSQKYIVANEQLIASSHGSNSNLYNDDELSDVKEVQTRLSVIAMEERENKLQRAEDMIANSNIAKSGISKTSARSELKKGIFHNNEEDIALGVPVEKRERIEKVLAKGKAAPKDSKARAITTRNAINMGVLGTQESGVMKSNLGDDMKAKLERAATVTARGDKGKTVAPIKKARSGIVNNLMRTLSKETFKIEQDDIGAAKPAETHLAAPSYKLSKSTGGIDSQKPVAKPPPPVKHLSARRSIKRSLI